MIWTFPHNWWKMLIFPPLIRDYFSTLHRVKSRNKETRSLTILACTVLRLLQVIPSCPTRMRHGLQFISCTIPSFSFTLDCTTSRKPYSTNYHIIKQGKKDEIPDHIIICLSLCTENLHQAHQLLATSVTLRELLALDGKTIKKRKKPLINQCPSVLALK